MCFVDHLQKKRLETSHNFIQKFFHDDFRMTGGVLVGSNNALFVTRPNNTS